jgi:DNA-binding transcriptional LysR family regulator
MQQHFHPWSENAAHHRPRTVRPCSALGSFTAAAHEADLLPGQVAAAIKRLERELDVRLFARTPAACASPPRASVPATAQRVLDTCARAMKTCMATTASLRGVLQVAAPSDLGRNLLLPWLSAFRREHPGLSLRFLPLRPDGRLHRDPVDVAIRYGLNEDANYIALPLAPWNRRWWWPPRLPGPPRPAANARRTATARLPVVPQHSRVYDKWRLGNRTVQVRGPLFSDDADVVRRWALEGEGIVYKSWLDVSADIAAGALEILLPEHPGEPTPVTLVCPHRKQITLRWRSFMAGCANASPRCARRGMCSRSAPAYSGASPDCKELSPMPSLEFLLTALIIVLIPGSGVILTVSSALVAGRRACLWTALGCTLGIVPHLLASVLGLSALLHASALAFQGLKFAGVAYLLHLAYATWRDRAAFAVDEKAPPAAAASWCSRPAC